MPSIIDNRYNPSRISEITNVYGHAANLLGGLVSPEPIGDPERELIEFYNRNIRTLDPVIGQLINGNSIAEGLGISDIYGALERITRASIVLIRYTIRHGRHSANIQRARPSPR